VGWRQWLVGEWGNEAFTVLRGMNQESLIQASAPIIGGEGLTEYSGRERLGKSRLTVRTSLHGGKGKEGELDLKLSRELKLNISEGRSRV